MDSLRVWSKFSAVKRDGSVVNLRIQDMPDDRFEDVMDFNLEYFAKHEIFHKAAGIDKNPEALAECRAFISEMMKDPEIEHHIAICCEDTGSDDLGDIIGVSSMCLSTDDEEFDMDDLDIKTKEMKRFFELMEVQFGSYDVMADQKVKKSYDGRGIAVHPKYRGLGIATEFCKIRPLICKGKDVPLTWASMTSLGSQKAAERAGWETVFEIPFHEIEEKSGVTFDGAPPSCKIMVARVS